MFGQMKHRSRGGSDYLPETGREWCGYGIGKSLIFGGYALVVYSIDTARSSWKFGGGAALLILGVVVVGLVDSFHAARTISAQSSSEL